MWAALEDDELDDAGEEGDDELEDEEEDCDWSEPVAPGAMWPCELSDENLSDVESDAADTMSDTEGTAASEATEEVFGTPERKRSS